MTRNFSLLSFIFCICLTSNCKKEQGTNLICSEANTVKFPLKWRQYFFFRDSTYWIYKDSATGTEDSAYVINSREVDLNNEYGETLTKKCYEILQYSIKDFTKNTAAQIWLQPRVVNDNIYSQEYHHIKLGIEKYNYAGVYRFAFTDSVLTASNQEGGLVYLIDNFIVNKINYSNVIAVDYKDGGTDIYKIAYYAPKIGLIKYVMKDNSVWELINYKIKQ